MVEFTKIGIERAAIESRADRTGHRRSSLCARVCAHRTNIALARAAPQDDPKAAAHFCGISVMQFAAPACVEYCEQRMRLLRTSTPSHAQLLLAVSALVVCSACASTSSQLAQRFAREHQCPEAQVIVSEAGGNAYHASGCGQATEYVCSTFATSNSRVACEEQGVRGHEPPSEPRSPSPDPAGPHAPPGASH